MAEPSATGLALEDRKRPTICFQPTSRRRSWAHICLDDQLPAHSKTSTDAAYLVLTRSDRKLDVGLYDLGLVPQARESDGDVKYETRHLHYGLGRSEQVLWFRFTRCRDCLSFRFRSAAVQPTFLRPSSGGSSSRSWKTGISDLEL